MRSSESTLGELLGVEGADEDACYAAMGWLLARQVSLEKALAECHLAEGSLVLYDVTSTYFEGRTCRLAKLGHSRDGKKDKLQIVIGLLTNGDGRPVAVEVFEGNTGDPKTLASQVRKLRERFGLARVVLVGDRGMITEARIREDLSQTEGLDWITALRAPAIAALVHGGSLQLSLFDERDLEAVAKAVARAQRPLRGVAQIGLRVGKVMGRFKMAKHFTLTITDDALRYERNEPAIAAEAALDGIYVVRTTVGAELLSPEDVVLSYKRLAHVERAFRSLKTLDLHIRPIQHRQEPRPAPCRQRHGLRRGHHPHAQPTTRPRSLARPLFPLKSS